MIIGELLLLPQQYSEIPGNILTIEAVSSFLLYQFTPPRETRQVIQYVTHSFSLCVLSIACPTKILLFEAGDLWRIRVPLFRYNSAYAYTQQSVAPF